jgi:hypothetical protein
MMITVQQYDDDDVDVDVDVDGDGNDDVALLLLLMMMITVKQYDAFNHFFRSAIYYPGDKSLGGW